MGKKVTIVDSMMGTGKTSYAIQLMQEAEIEQNFIYVTPFLEEVQRIKDAVRNRNFKEPDTHHGSGTKLQSLKRLVASGEDIATTHALFAMADEELMGLIRWGNYTLIIDEVMEVVSQLRGLRKDDISVLLESGLIEIDYDNRVIWKADPKSDTQYNIVKGYALAGNLYSVNKTAFIWNFPAKIFDMFEQAYIMTYMFDGQLQKYYYDLHNIEYEYYAVIKDGGTYKLTPKTEADEDRTKLKELIRIYEGKLNDVGDKETALSKSWFDNRYNKDKMKRLKNNLYNYYRNVTHANSDSFLWTVFKDCKTAIMGKGFSRGEPKEENVYAADRVGKACFIPFNLRATNKYKHKTILAFCLNRYMNPIEKQFFYQHNVKVDQDLLALSDLLQWLFRSAIREGKPVQLYLPSRRMRELLMKWLNNEL